ncbi:MAG: hypothetical protein QXX30_00870 [Candidatus Aenigmatarchaeota archaeon]
MLIKVQVSKVLKLELDCIELQRGRGGEILCLIREIKFLVPAVGSGYFGEDPEWVELFHPNSRDVEVPSWIENIRTNTLIIYDSYQEKMKLFYPKKKITIRKGESYEISNELWERIVENYLSISEVRLGWGGLWLDWGRMTPERRRLWNELFPSPSSNPSSSNSMNSMTREEEIEKLIREQISDYERERRSSIQNLSHKERFDDWGYPYSDSEEESEAEDELELRELFDYGGFSITETP